MVASSPAELLGLSEVLSAMTTALWRWTKADDARYLEADEMLAYPDWSTNSPEDQLRRLYIWGTPRWRMRSGAIWGR